MDDYTDSNSGSHSMSQKTHRPLALCAEHGLFEADFGFRGGGGGGGSVGFVGFSVICPHCGRLSAIVPGVYKGDDEKLELLLDPSVSSEMLEAFRRLATDVQTGRITPEAAEREAEKIHPKAAKLFNVASWSDQAKATLYGPIVGSIIGSIIAGVITARMSSPPTQNLTVQPVIERVVPLPTGITRPPTMQGSDTATLEAKSPEPSMLTRSLGEENKGHSKRKSRRLAGKEKGSHMRS
jgi:hypothetical protein